MMSRYLVLLALVGCGGAAAEMTPAAGPKADVASTKPAAHDPLPSMSLRRSDVRAVVDGGLGRFLQAVAIDQPVFLAGKFHGFRIASLPKNWSIDLKPGDVVTSVNGFSVERPESAFEAFESLKVASELRVDYERNGEPKALRWAIVED